VTATTSPMAWLSSDSKVVDTSLIAAKSAIADTIACGPVALNGANDHSDGREDQSLPRYPRRAGPRLLCSGRWCGRRTRR
jgi:hypothetical protein